MFIIYTHLFNFLMMGIQISLVRFFVFKNLFQNKMNKSIKVLSIAAYYFFPSLRQFSISAKEVNW